MLEVLLEAHWHGREIQGWEIKKATRRSGPTVYGVIDRLEDAKLIEGYWEDQDSSDKGPRRRYYRLTGAGVATASKLTAERRERSGAKISVVKRRLAVDHGGPR